MHTLVLADLPPITSSISIVDVISLLVLPVVLPSAVGWVTRLVAMPKLAKRLSLGGLSLATTVLTDIVEASSTGTPYDIGWGLLHFAAVWGAAELTYYGLLKAPIEVPTPIEGELDVTNLKALTKAELIDYIENPAEITTEDSAKSLATIIQGKE